MNSDDLDKANYFVSDEYADIKSPLKKDSYPDDSYFMKSNQNSGARIESQENSIKTVTKLIGFQQSDKYNASEQNDLFLFERKRINAAGLGTEIDYNNQTHDSIIKEGLQQENKEDQYINSYQNQYYQPISNPKSLASEYEFLNGLGGIGMSYEGSNQINSK